MLGSWSRYQLLFIPSLPGLSLLSLVARPCCSARIISPSSTMLARSRNSKTGSGDDGNFMSEGQLGKCVIWVVGVEY